MPRRSTRSRSSPSAPTPRGPWTCLAGAVRPQAAARTAGRGARGPSTSARAERSRTPSTSAPPWARGRLSGARPSSSAGRLHRPRRGRLARRGRRGREPRAGEEPRDGRRPNHAGDLRHAFSGIAERMAVVEYRSSFSPIIREMLDFSCGTFDARGHMISHAEQIPAQLGLMQFALQGGDRDPRPPRARRRRPLQPTLSRRDAHGSPALHARPRRGREPRRLRRPIAHHVDIGGRVRNGEH